MWWTESRFPAVGGTLWMFLLDGQVGGAGGVTEPRVRSVIALRGPKSLAGHQPWGVTCDLWLEGKGWKTLYSLFHKCFFFCVFYLLFCFIVLLFWKWRETKVKVKQIDDQKVRTLYRSLTIRTQWISCYRAFAFRSWGGAHFTFMHNAATTMQQLLI